MEASPEQQRSRPRMDVQLVLELWEARVREKVPAARGKDGAVIRNDVPALLERVARILASASPREQLDREEALAAAHGKKRAALHEFSLDQIVFEYQLLRQTIFEVLEERAPVDAATRDLVLDIIQTAVRNAAATFVQHRDADKQRAHEALNNANAALEDRVRERTAELSRSEDRFRTMVEVVKDYAIFTVDPNGYITSWNTGAHRMKGYAVNEAVGRHFSMLYPEEGNRRDEPMNHLRVAAAEGRFRGEGVRVRKNGDLFMADVSITPIYEAGKLMGFTKVVQDLTERNLLMQERDLTRTRAARLEAESEYRKRFVATMTHDLRSPLSAAKSAAYMISRTPDDHDKIRTWALRITDAVDRTDRMISDLLDSSRMEAGGRLPLKFEHCDVKKIAEELSEELSTRHGARFVVEATGDSTGYWSVEGLRRVLDNLLANAVKYGDPMVTITTRITRVQDRVLVAVHNQGTIIPREEQEKLFHPFHRTTLAEASDKRGWGLGLTLVKGIVESHHGVVKVESYPKTGTTFTVDLPVDSRAAGAAEAENQNKEIESP